MVSWQNNSFYRELKVQERETGLSLADRNRLQNPYGTHSTGGMITGALLSLLLSGNGANILTSCAEYFSSDKNDKPEDVKSVEEKTSKLSEFNKARENFEKAKKDGNTKNMYKYLAEMVLLGKEDPNNKTIQSALNLLGPDIKQF